MVTRVLKITPHAFEGSDNDTIEGVNIYLHITKDNGAVDTRRVFVTNDRLAAFAYIPKAGDAVLVFAKDKKVLDMLKDDSPGARKRPGAGSADELPFD